MGRRTGSSTGRGRTSVSGGCPGGQHLMDTQRCQNHGPMRVLVPLLEFNHSFIGIPFSNERNVKKTTTYHLVAGKGQCRKTFPGSKQPISEPGKSLPCIPR